MSAKTERIADLELELEVFRKDRDEWSDMFDSVHEAYSKEHCLVEECQAEIKMLLEFCAQHGITIPDDKHCIDLKMLID